MSPDNDMGGRQDEARSETMSRSERDTHQAEHFRAQDSRALWTYSIVKADVGQH